MSNPPDPPALSLLQYLHTTHAPNPGTPSAQEIHSVQIAHKSLILRATSPDPSSQDARSIRRKVRLSTAAKSSKVKKAAKRLSAREKRVLGVYDLELRNVSGEVSKGRGRRKTSAGWEVWKGLYVLWCGYVHEVFALSGTGGSGKGSKAPAQAQGGEKGEVHRYGLSPQSIGSKITSLELHGALVRVVKATCSSMVGVWGVCVRETKGSFVLVDDQCVVRRVGKRGVVFAVEIPLVLPGVEGGRLDGEEKQEKQENAGFDVDAFLRGEGERIVFEISGRAIECRPADRATKKFKGRKYDGF